MSISFKRSNSLSPSEKDQILRLWNKEYPAVIALKDHEALDHFLLPLQNTVHTLVLNIDEKILGWFAEFDRDEEHWFLMILNSKVQGKGIGSRLLEMSKTSNLQLNAWVVTSQGLLKSDLTSYFSPLTFYLKNGFQELDSIKKTEQMTTVKIRWNSNSKT